MYNKKNSVRNAEIREILALMTAYIGKQLQSARDFLLYVFYISLMKLKDIHEFHILAAYVNKMDKKSNLT